MKLVRVEELRYELWRSIAELYRREPLTHAYLLYDLVYELERVEAAFAVDRRVRGYVLIWKGARRLGVHVWGDALNLLPLIPLKEEAVIQVYDASLLEPLLKTVGEGGEVQVRWYLDMVVSEEEFRPRYGPKVVRLKAGDIEHVRQYVNLKAAGGIAVEEEEAREVLGKYRYYGVFEEGRLASIACTYLRLPEVWVIGDVYTHPAYRGRGYAKAATSAITSDAISAGAIAMLHVAEGNEPALRVYRALGYRVTGRKPWVFYSPHRATLRD